MRRHLLPLALLTALLPVAPVLAADPAPRPPPASVASQLPRVAAPRHYALEVTPHAEQLTFDGRVTIDLDVVVPTRSLTLNALDLQFDRVRLTPAQGAPLVPTVRMDAQAQTATLQFARALAPGRYRLAIDYRGKIGTQANGLFALDYPTAQGQQRALYTQFENSDARRFLPSWDEPWYKASFDLTVTAPAGQMAVGNMPVAERTELGDGRVRTRFATTPRMSTYLLFLALGDFERAAAAGDNGTEIGVITQRGKLDQAQYALDAGRAVLREYNAYFGIPYPLPKLDNVAAPGRSQFFSAMENWGAIFTFESSLLLDPAIANLGDRQRIFTVAAHEIAHQWFGDLVTMAWWDDLWLNEGFATWMEGRTTQKLHPEWDPDHVDAVLTSRGPMQRDALATTHPVVQHVATVEQASQAFDDITYRKGSAVINMLEDYVGADAWQAGVRRYLRAHAYGNAVTDDLWRAVDAQAPGKRFVQVAHDFTRQPGVPLIRAEGRCVGGRMQVQLVQGEYTLDRPAKRALRWRVPVAVRAADGTVQRTLVDGRARLRLPACGAFVVNAGQKGYYRTLYAPAQFAALRGEYLRLPVMDQLGLLMDAGALAAAGLQPEADALDLMAAVPLDASADLWMQVVGQLGGIDALYDGDPRQAAFRRYAIARLAPKLAQLGWDPAPQEPANVQQLRLALLGALSQFGDAQVVAEARRRFAAFRRDPATLPADLRRTVLAIVARNADAPTWDELHAMARAESSSLLRDQYYGLLALPRDPALAQRALELALSGEAGATNGADLIARVAGEHPELAFDFATAHRAQVDAMVDSTSRARYYPRLAAASNDAAIIARLRAFAERYIAPTSRRDADTVIAGIQARLAQRQRRLPQIEAWLARQPG
ncbi:M1 family metallopeptidase [Thermomonas flagellata]|uniref:M1 family metallopeptidase n=1 Tax=Thermomonas flagellata TaxID=2888524 RepID=UPI001F04D7E8|nr:M1 family metallopeptidase [Thermomonas flagellata]